MRACAYVCACVCVWVDVRVSVCACKQIYACISKHRDRYLLDDRFFFGGSFELSVSSLSAQI